MLWKANFNGESSENSLYTSESSDNQQEPCGQSVPYCKKLSYEDSRGTDDDDELQFNNKNYPDTSVLVDARKTENFQLTDAVEVCE